MVAPRLTRATWFLFALLCLFFDEGSKRGIKKERNELLDWICCCLLSFFFFYIILIAKIDFCGPLSFLSSFFFLSILELRSLLFFSFFFFKLAS